MTNWKTVAVTQARDDCVSKQVVTIETFHILCIFLRYGYEISGCIRCGVYEKIQG